MQYKMVNVILDSYSAVFLLILVFYLLASSSRNIRLNRIFSLICISNLAMLLGDIPFWLCQGPGPSWYPAAVWAGNLVQYFGGVALPLSYTFYVAVFLSSKVKINRIPLIVIGILGGIGCLFVIINQWNGMYYYMDGQNIYHRGNWWPVSQLIAVTTLAIDAGIVFHYRHTMQKKDVCAFLGYNICPLTAVLIQSLYYGLALTYPAATISILIIFLNIQSEQAFRLEQSKKELAESRIAVMLGQIQPHFLYNSLAAIRQLCRIDPVQAEEAVGEFAQFLRGNMESLSQIGLIPFEQELIHVKSYLALEQRRFGKNLTVVYDITCTDFKVPPLSLQPIVENAVRHGVFSQDGDGVVTFHTRRMSEGWEIVIHDNGKGMGNMKTCLQGEQSHIGIENVCWRLRELAGGSLDIRSLPGEGTTVTVFIPEGGENA